MNRISVLAYSLSLLTFSGVTYAQANISSEFSRLDPQSQVNIIVKWKVQPTDRHDFKVTSRGGLAGTHFSSIRSGSYRLSMAATADLANDSEVEHISVDHTLSGKLDNTAGAINAAAAWHAGLVGTGVGVAVIDSGMNAVPDLSVYFGYGSRITYTEDFVNPTVIGMPSNTYGQDQYGHGEHVAGIIAGNGASSRCGNCTRIFVGAAPNASLINLRVLDQNGAGTDSTVIAAIERAIAIRNAYNIRVINLSLGRPIYESYQNDPLCQAVEAAWKAGIVVVVAAGNDGRDDSFGNFGYGTINSPGNDPYVITVGAMRSMGTPTRADDLIASYSSKGPSLIDHVVKPDLVAPGNLVVSLNVPGSTLMTESPANEVPLSYYQSNGSTTQDSTSYFTLSGTSMAAGVVSGAIADVLQANPRLTPDQVKYLLMESAYKTFPTTSSVYDVTVDQTFTSYYDIFTVGAGYLDLGAALAIVNSVPPNVVATSPAAAYDPSTGAVTLFENSAVTPNRTLWGAQSVWSNAVLQGAQVVWNSQTMWGCSSGVSDSSTVWGTQTLWGASAVDSSSAVEGSRTLWGADIQLSGDK